MINTLFDVFVASGLLAGITVAALLVVLALSCIRDLFCGGNSKK